MIKEYAVEPQALNNWKDCRYILEKFGFANGRLISRFPKEWERMVYEAWQGLLPKEKSRISELLIRAKKNLMVSNRDYDRSKTWLPNAEEQHVIKPFHAIIATSNPSKNGSLVLADDLDDEHPLMQSDITPTINRKAAEMAECVAPLLRISKRVIFIDQYLNKVERRHFDPLKEFMLILKSRDSNIPLNKLEYHCGEINAETYFDQKLTLHIKESIPSGKTLEIICWPNGELHNRYILTDRGGVMFGTGLDDDDRGSGTPTDVVTRLDGDTYEGLWAKHDDCSIEFILRIEGV